MNQYIASRVSQNNYLINKTLNSSISAKILNVYYTQACSTDCSCILRTSLSLHLLFQRLSEFSSFTSLFSSRGLGGSISLSKIFDEMTLLINNEPNRLVKFGGLPSDDDDEANGFRCLIWPMQPILGDNGSIANFCLGILHFLLLKETSVRGEESFVAGARKHHAGLKELTFLLLI